MPLEIEAFQRDALLVVRVAGELDYHSFRKLEERLQTALNDKPRPSLILNLLGLTFTDSAGLGSLVKLANQIKGRRGRLWIVPSDSVDKLLSMTGLAKLFHIAATEDEAIKQAT